MFLKFSKFEFCNMSKRNSRGHSNLSQQPKTFFKLIYLFLAALCLYCCARASSSCGEWGLLFVVVRRLLVAVASPVVEHRL